MLKYAGQKDYFDRGNEASTTYSADIEHIKKKKKDIDLTCFVNLKKVLQNIHRETLYCIF